MVRADALTLRILRGSFDHWATLQEQRYLSGEIADTPPFPVCLRLEVGRRLLRDAARRVRLIDG